MGFLKSFFTGKVESAEEQAQKEEAKRFDKLKYDGVRATRSGQPDIAIHCFEEALKIHEDMEIRDYLARTLISVDALPQAIEQLQLLAQAAPDRWRPFPRNMHRASSPNSSTSTHGRSSETM